MIATKTRKFGDSPPKQKHDLDFSYTFIKCKQIKLMQILIVRSLKLHKVEQFIRVTQWWSQGGAVGGSVMNTDGWMLVNM